jgi:hypothetical protein
VISTDRISYIQTWNTYSFKRSHEVSFIHLSLAAVYASALHTFWRSAIAINKTLTQLENSYRAAISIVYISSTDVLVHNWLADSVSLVMGKTRAFSFVRCYLWSHTLMNQINNARNLFNGPFILSWREGDRERASRLSIPPVCTWFHLNCRIKIRLIPQWVVH